MNKTMMPIHEELEEEPWDPYLKKFILITVVAAIAVGGYYILIKK